ncbi:MAG: hypothetical protein ACM3ZC_12925 [Bacteroidota bacterium]
MRERTPMVWRNLALLYLAILLVMTTWGETSRLLHTGTRPAAAAAESGRRGPFFLESLGLWPQGSRPWRRCLQLGLPGLSLMQSEKSTLY